jgi:hypothetical protein
MSLSVSIEHEFSSEVMTRTHALAAAYFRERRERAETITFHKAQPYLLLCKRDTCKLGA